MKKVEYLSTVHIGSYEDWDVYSENVKEINILNHSYYANYKNNILFSLAWGRKSQNHNFNEPWINNKFPDPTVEMIDIDCFYSGVLVKRLHGLSVDGGKYIIPLPKDPKNLEILEGEYLILELINYLENENLAKDLRKETDRLGIIII